MYEALWERAQKDPLNETEVPDGYEVRRAACGSAVDFIDDFTSSLGRIISNLYYSVAKDWQAEEQSSDIVLSSRLDFHIFSMYHYFRLVLRCCCGSLSYQLNASVCEQ